VAIFRLEPAATDRRSAAGGSFRERGEDARQVGLALGLQLAAEAALAAELADAKTVVVELDQSAYDLSLEGLKTPAGIYFGEKYSVIYSPGLWMEQQLRNPAAIGQAQSLFLLDATHPGYLPGMEAERAFIVSQKSIHVHSMMRWTRSERASEAIFSKS